MTNKKQDMTNRSKEKDLVRLFFFNMFQFLASLPEVRGGFRGGGGTDALSSGIQPPADPKGPPFGTF